MIDTRVKIHDKYTFEFKISFITNHNQRDNINEFSINTWIFIPNSLDINRSTYSKDLFYKDITSNIRLITPIYSLKQIYNHESAPNKQLKEAFECLSNNPNSTEAIEDYTYQLKMFLSICKSAMRDRAYFINEIIDDQQIPSLINEYLEDIDSITKVYRKLRSLISHDTIDSDLKAQYYFGDEFLGNIIEQQLFRLMRGLNDRSIYTDIKCALSKAVYKEIDYKKKNGYQVLNLNDSVNENYLVVMRRGILKKFIESDLYLNTKKKKDGAFAEQFLYGIAAGVAMIFATVVSFTAQQRYGNFTIPLFFALVVSYVFKDRIKDLMRYYFSSQLGHKYYDTKRELEIRDNNIGWTKESFDFVLEEKVPNEVISLRKRSPLVEAENKVYNEQILLYKKLVNLSSTEIRKEKYYKFDGVNDITRFNILNYLKKTDNPLVPLYIPDDEKGYITFEGTKVYALYFIIRCESKSEIYYRKYRLLINREGIQDIAQFEY